MTVKATRVEDIDDAQDIPGAIEFVENRDAGVAGLCFMCPCGCGNEGYLPFRRGQPEKHPSWIFDGNYDSPSLTPSILQSGLPCRWHGYLTKGEFVPC